MYDRVKRVLDVVVSVGALIVILPVWMAVSMLIKLTSPGPVLYRGTRVGRSGRTFTMYKFRTMMPGADKSGPSITGARDPRITPLGAALRAWKLDELPQLINVLRGEMSLVGPRPEAPEYVALYDARQRAVLDVRPGITGPTQIRYRHEERLLDASDVEGQYRELLPRKLEIDLDYVQSRSLARDVRLLVSTARSIVEGYGVKQGRKHGANR